MQKVKHATMIPTKNNCTHTKYIWPGQVYNDYEDEWVEGDPYEVSTNEDIDIARFRCTQCGEIGYYSSAWRNYFENGGTSATLETSHESVNTMEHTKKLNELLSQPGLERLKEWYEIGPVQRSAVELLVESIVTECADFCGHDPSGVDAMLKCFGVKQ